MKKPTEDTGQSIEALKEAIVEQEKRVFAERDLFRQRYTDECRAHGETHAQLERERQTVARLKRVIESHNKRDVEQPPQDPDAIKWALGVVELHFLGIERQMPEGWVNRLRALLPPAEVCGKGGSEVGG